MRRNRSRRLPWYSKPRVILAWTIPLAFVGIIAGKAFNADAEIDATIAGGLLAILGDRCRDPQYKHSEA